MSDALSTVNSLVSSLNSSINNAVNRLQSNSSTEASSSVAEYEKTVRKSSSNLSMHATDIGILAKGFTRLNVVSTMASKDNVDFYKFKVTSTGEAALGNVGDEGLRVQVQTKLGVVVADSNKDAGTNYENYTKLAAGEFSLEKGDYVIRVSREKGDSSTGNKNYALQLSMGSFKQDYDTVAKQPQAGDSPWQLSGAQQAMISGLNDAISSMSSITYGQTGTQKLMGSFSLFV